jgi:hypothetical protein
MQNKAYFNNKRERNMKSRDSNKQPDKQNNAENSLTKPPKLVDFFDRTLTNFEKEIPKSFFLPTHTVPSSFKKSFNSEDSYSIDNNEEDIPSEEYDSGEDKSENPSDDKLPSSKYSIDSSDSDSQDSYAPPKEKRKHHTKSMTESNKSIKLEKFSFISSNKKVTHKDDKASLEPVFFPENKPQKK